MSVCVHCLSLNKSRNKFETVFVYVYVSVITFLAALFYLLHRFLFLFASAAFVFVCADCCVVFAATAFAFLCFVLLQ